MNFSFQLVSLFAGIVNLLIAAFVLFINPKRRLNRVYLAVGLALACWNLSGYILTLTETIGSATLAIKAMLMGAIFIPAAFFHLAAETTASMKQHSASVRILYVTAF